MIVIAAILASAPAWVASRNLRLMLEILVVLTMAQLWNLLWRGMSAFCRWDTRGSSRSGPMRISPITAGCCRLSFPFAVLICALVAAGIAPYLFRLRDAYFAIAIWVLADIARVTVTNTRWFAQIGIWGYVGARFGVEIFGVCRVPFEMTADIESREQLASQPRI
jgi:branched-chain amino acid transport system permease protein